MRVGPHLRHRSSDRRQRRRPPTARPRSRGATSTVAARGGEGRFRCRDQRSGPCRASVTPWPMGRRSMDLKLSTGLASAIGRHPHSWRRPVPTLLARLADTRPSIHPRTTRPTPSPGLGLAAEIDDAATHASGASIGQTRLRTLRIGPRTGLLVPARISGHIDSAEMAPDGFLSHPPSVRPSVGTAARSIAACSATRRRFVRLPATMIQSETVGGELPGAIHPRSTATLIASRRFRSAVPTSSLTSAISASVRSRAARADPGARPGCRSRRARRGSQTRLRVP